MVYSDNLTSIVNLPTREKITTIFSLNNESILKDEWVSFGEYFNNCGVEIVQSYAIADCMVSDSIINYFLNRSGNYLYFVSESFYCNFLTGLSCIWMFDGSSEDIGELFNVSVNRSNVAVVLSGVDFNHNAYIHTANPILGLEFNGDDNNTYFCRALSSLLLGEIEAKALGFSERESNSSLNTIFSEILNGRNYTLTVNDGILTIQLLDNENCSWQYNMDNGLVYDWTDYDNFSYKGAVSTNINTNCPYLFLDKVVGKIYKQVRYKGNISSDYSFRLSEHDKKVIAEVMASFALSCSALILKNYLPFLIMGITASSVILPLAVGVGLIAVAYGLNCYATKDYKKAIGDTLYSFVQSLYL